MAANNDEVFVYMGGDIIPRQDAVRARVHSSVTVIHHCAFQACWVLEEVELSEGIVEIGSNAFSYCPKLKHIAIPTTVKSIGRFAFQEAGLQSIKLPDGLERIASSAFFDCNFSTCRIPPLITSIPEDMFSGCRFMFSVELSENVTEIEQYAFQYCRSLRNLALPPDSEIQGALHGHTGVGRVGYTDLKQLFGSEEQIINALKHRFDNLPIHKMIYYQSYNNGHRRSLRMMLDTSGNEQDCLGMTPLHILACSSVQNLELYRVLIEKYPVNLITKDEWGALPLLYAVWGSAPNEVVQLLVESYLTIYPDYELNWTLMVGTLGEAGASPDVLRNLIDLQQASFPGNTIDWGTVLEKECRPFLYSDETFRFILKCSISTRVGLIGLKQWRDDMMNDIDNMPLWGSIYRGDHPRAHIITAVQNKLAHYETEYHKLKEATTGIELALWKNKMMDHCQGARRHSKRRKVGESDLLWS